MAEFESISTAEASNADDMTKMLQDMQGSIRFVIKKLRPSHVAEDSIRKNCTLMIPVWFVKEHGDKFQESVALRSRLSTEPWRVQLNICNKPPRSPEIKFGKGWKAFATRTELLVGDSLIFELSGVSEFEVHVFRGTTGNPTSVSSSQAPKKRSTDPKLSQKNGNYDSSASCSSHQRLASERSEGSVDDLSGWIAKRRKVGDAEGEVSASQSTLQNSSCMNLDTVQAASSLEMSHNSSQNSQEPPTGDESEQNAGSRIVHVKMELEHSKICSPGGIVHIYYRKVYFLYEDLNAFLMKIKIDAERKDVDRTTLPKRKYGAKSYENNTMASDGFQAYETAMDPFL